MPANGWTNDAFHVTKGLLTKLAHYAPLGPDRDAVTEYTWDAKWERVTQVTFPEQNVLQFAYDRATGNRLWQQDGRGTPSRVEFAYQGAGAGASRVVLASVTHAADPAGARARDSVVYDTLSNVIEDRRAVGTSSEGVTRFAHDAVGRTREARVLIDATSARVWSRGEIDAEAQAWCEIHGGAAAGQTVAIAEPNGAEWLQVFLGLLKSNAVIGPLDPGDPVDAQRALALNIGAPLLWRKRQLELLGTPRRPRRGRRTSSPTWGRRGCRGRGSGTASAPASS